MDKQNNISVYIEDNSPTLIEGLVALGFRKSLIDDFKGEITVITDGVITTADRDFPRSHPEYQQFYPCEIIQTEVIYVKD